MARALDILTISEEYRRVCGRYVKKFRPTKVKHFAYRRWEDIEWREVARAKATPLLVVCHIADIPVEKSAQQPKLGQKMGRYLMFTGEMPPQALPPRVSRLNIRNAGRLHIAKINDSQKAEGVIARLILGMAVAQSNRIVDAWWEGKNFVVLSPEFKRLVVPLDKLLKFIGNKSKKIDAYEIDIDGSFIYWPHADVHLGWMQLLRLVDPMEALSAEAKHRDFNVRYGLAIRVVREDSGLRQLDVSGLTTRQVGRIEKGECRATHSALSKLASAHGMDISNYLEQLAGKLT